MFYFSGPANLMIPDREAEIDGGDDPEIFVLLHCSRHREPVGRGHPDDASGTGAVADLAVGTLRLP